MHLWGDEWFEKHGDDLYTAINVLERRLRKWAKVGVCGKEKWGCYRDEYLRFWDGALGVIFCGYNLWWGRHWWNKMWYVLDYRLIPVKKTKYGWIKAGFSDLNRKLGLVKIVNKWQARQINKAFQFTCKEYPDLIDELISDIDCYRCIKPCKWGDIDGETIHNKYWKKID